MRTTLTLDDDVAAKIERLRKAKDITVRDIVNEALRRGLAEMSGKTKKLERFQTPVYGGGAPLMDNLDNVHEVLSAVESDRRA